jgi:hypothetical protein
MRTATSSHSSPDVEVSDDAPGVPPNHHTLREVDDDDDDDWISSPMLYILRNGGEYVCLYKVCENEPVAVAMLVNAATLPILPDDRRTHPLSIEFLIIVMEIRSVVRGHSGMLSMLSRIVNMLLVVGMPSVLLRHHIIIHQQRSNGGVAICCKLVEIVEANILCESQK